MPKTVDFYAERIQIELHEFLLHLMGHTSPALRCTLARRKVQGSDEELAGAVHETLSEITERSRIWRAQLKCSHELTNIKLNEVRVCFHACFRRSILTTLHTDKSCPVIEHLFEQVYTCVFGQSILALIVFKVTI
jgi:hypothetical protein